MVVKGEVGRGGKGGEFGISRGQILYLGWISNKVLLYSTGDHIQPPATYRNGKEYGKVFMYMCMYNRVPLLYSGKLTQPCK